MAQADAAIQAIQAQLEKLAERQEHMIRGLIDMGEMVGIVLATVNEIAAWTQQPAGEGLGDAMAEIAGALGRINGNMMLFAEQVAALNRRFEG